MNLSLPREGIDVYHSASQRARVGTEAWGAANFFCPSCDSPKLDSAPRGTPAIDYVCPRCTQSFQLKSQSRPFGRRIVDSVYSEMRRAILESRAPNLYVMHYDRTGWSVRTVILIPHFAFALSCIERRSPLTATARRAGWIGCNILLSQIPDDARIPVIASGLVRPASAVRGDYLRLRPLENFKAEARGWTLDVLHAVRSLGRQEFSLADVYARENSLAALHPDNRHIRPKIRQQLQILRDMGLLAFLSPGRYRLL